MSPRKAPPKDTSNEDAKGTIGSESDPRITSTEWGPEVTQKPKREFGLGHLKGPQISAPSIRHRLGAPAVLPAWASLLSAIEEIENQGAANSCVGVRLAQNIDIRFLRQYNKRATHHCSGSGVYAGARMLEAPGAALPLVDRGSMPEFALQFMQRHGIPREDKWPYDVERINERPDMATWDESFTFPLAQAHVIDGEGQGKVRDVMNAIANGFPVGAAVEWTKAYDETNGRELLGPPEGEVLGGHYVGLVHYETFSDGTTKFRLLNQYGAGWADGGMAWVTDEAVAAMFDLIVVEGVPQEWAD